MLSLIIAMNVVPAIRDIFHGRMTLWNSLIMMLPLLAFLGILGYVELLIARSADPAFALSLLVLVVLNVVFFILLQTPTRLGRERMDQVEGFRQFLEAVDLDRVDRMNNPHWRPTLHIDYLAYAIALDLKQAWGDHLVNAMMNTVTVAE
ncbi:MAG: DUF2207 domain-containing protein [Acidobacteriia bacterium]|nr:DUF2207 domain-containing protein [Terriglobia bacterium]